MAPVKLALKFLGAGLEYQTQSSSTFTSRRGVVERGSDFEVLNGVRVGERNGIEVRQVEVIHVDSIQRHAVITRTLTVDVHVNITSSRGPYIDRFIPRAS